MSFSFSDIAAIRKDYRLAELDESVTGDDPLAFFGKWFVEAQAAEVSEVNAMTLATVSKNSKPHARIVLLKGLDKDGFVFYTNYDSDKGREIEDNPFGALIFFWHEVERQVRVEGRVERVSEEENDVYFQSRPEGSKLGAWSSPQSQPIPDRSILENNYHHYEQQFSGKEISRPVYWGGYRVIPEKVEFWQGRSNRMHDRIVFVRSDAAWKKFRIAP